MRWRLVPAVLAVLLLSGCWWIGPPFYKGDPGDAAPFAPGVYKIRFFDDGKPSHRVRVAWQRDGTTLVTPLKPDAGEPESRSVFAHFVVPGRDLWVVQGTDLMQGKVSYGLVEMRGEILWGTPAIDCESTRAIVRAAGGKIVAEDVVGDGANAPHRRMRPSPLLGRPAFSMIAPRLNARFVPMSPRVRLSHESRA